MRAPRSAAAALALVCLGAASGSGSGCIGPPPAHRALVSVTASGDVDQIVLTLTRSAPPVDESVVAVPKGHDITQDPIVLEVLEPADVLTWRVTGRDAASVEVARGPLLTGPPGGHTEIMLTANASAPTLLDDSGVPGDHLTNADAPRLLVACSPGQTAVLTWTHASAAGGQAEATCAVGPSVEVQVDPSLAADGLWAFVAWLEDPDSGASGESPPTVIHLDTQPPPAPGAPALDADDDSGALDRVTRHPQLTVTVDCEPEATVAVIDAATSAVVSTSQTCGDLQWVALELLLDPGSWALAAVQTDPAGNTSAPSPIALVEVRPTTQAPSIPALAPGSDSGVLGDSVTRVANPDLEVLCEDGVTVAVTLTPPEGAAREPLTLGPELCGAKGAVSLSSAELTPDGVWSAQASALDGAGNTAWSGALEFTLDTVISAPLLDLPPAQDTGSADDDDVTQAGVATVTMTCEPAAATTLTGAGAEQQSSCPADGWLVWQFEPLPEGVHTLEATATDLAGNVATDALVVTIDQQIFVGTPDLTPETDRGASDSDDLTSGASLAFDVACAPGDLVELSAQVDAHEPTTATAVCASGLTTFKVDQPSHGAWTVTAVAHDLAGNESAPSTPLLVAVDQAAPDASDLSLSFLDTTVAPQLAVTGCPEDDGFALVLFTPTPSGALIHTVSPCPDPQPLWSGQSGPPGGEVATDLAPGLTYDVTAYAVDAAGNASLAPLTAQFTPSSPE